MSTYEDFPWNMGKLGNAVGKSYGKVWRTAKTWLHSRDLKSFSVVRAPRKMRLAGLVDGWLIGLWSHGTTCEFNPKHGQACWF